MQGVTLTIATIISTLAVILRPPYALAIYVTALVWYPNYLTVSVGTIDISVGRIVVGVLLLRCLFDSRIRRKFTWSRLDTLVALSMIVYVVVTCITQPMPSSLENRGGFLMDTWFAYLVTRFLITKRKDLLAMLKFVSVVLAPLAILGVIESVTGKPPFRILLGSSSFFRHVSDYGLRFGFNRAVGPFSHSILFGCAFAMFLPLIYYFRHEKGDWRTLAYILSSVAMAGALSSMSSGPWVMVLVMIFCLSMEKYKHWVKPMFIFFVFSCVFIAIASNRPFYHVIASYANPLGGSGWHRAKLIDLAIEDFDKWWLVGFGTEDPGWSYRLGMGKTDITNEFILAGVKYGILGVISLCAVLTLSFRGLIRAYRKTIDPKLRSLYWSLGCILFSVIVTWMSVSFFGQLMPLFYFFLGIIGSSFGFVPNEVGYIKHTSYSPDYQKAMV